MAPNQMPETGHASAEEKPPRPKGILERMHKYLLPRFSLSEIKIYRTSWIKRINKIYRKYRIKFKKKINFFSKNL
jgi:hypothetical protein